LRAGGKCYRGEFSVAAAHWAEIAGTGKFLPGGSANTSTFHQMADAKKLGKPRKILVQAGTRDGEQV
jgi:hypothetical protein